MPNKEFLEKYPLYRKFKLELPTTSVATMVSSAITGRATEFIKVPN